MQEFTRPRVMVPNLEPLLECWAISDAFVELNEGASDLQINQAEEMLGRRLPPALRALYQVSNGCKLLGKGDIEIDPLWPSFGNESTNALVNRADILRQWGWPIPDELVIFGNISDGNLIGMWVPIGLNINASHPVIQISALPTNPKCMAVAGTTLCRFLKVRTAYSLLKCRCTSDLMDELDVPDDLRNAPPDLARIYAWADPDLPNLMPDPDRNGFDAEELRNKYGQNQKIWE